MVTVFLLMIGYQAMLISMWDVATDGLGWILPMVDSERCRYRFSYAYELVHAAQTTFGLLYCLQ